MRLFYFLLLLSCCHPAVLGTKDSPPRHLLASVKRHAKGHGRVAACAGKKIYILDLNAFAEVNGTPVCRFTKVCLASVMLVYQRADTATVCTAYLAPMPYRSVFQHCLLWLCVQQDVKSKSILVPSVLPDAPGGQEGVPLATAAHAGPWHLRRSIESSEHKTNDIDAADIVFVYDFCFYAQWLAQVTPQHSGISGEKDLLPDIDCHTTSRVHS